MKQLLITIAVILVSACGRFENSKPETNASGNYIMSEPEKGVFLNLTLNPNGSFSGISPISTPEDKLIGNWKPEGDLLILEGTFAKRSEVIKIKFNKTTGKVSSVNSNGKEVPTEELDQLIVKKN